MATLTKSQAERDSAFIPRIGVPTLAGDGSYGAVRKHANDDVAELDEILSARAAPETDETFASGQNNGDNACSTWTKAKSSPRPRKLIRVRNVEAPPRRFRTLQCWEGQVIGVEGSEITARIVDLTKPDLPDEIVEFDVSNFSVSDRVLAVEGAIFYWTIGFETRKGGQISNVSEMRMRRAPEWSTWRIERIKSEALATFKKAVGNEPESPASERST